jgi:3-phenylpropionate/cinnamic acid dioxygenase small subunit
MPLSADDHAAIIDLLARYSWYVDEGDGESWADLWTMDGSFTGIPDPLHGRAALRGMPLGFHAGFGGKLRHHLTNVLLNPGAQADEARVRAYSVLSDWREGGKLSNFAKADFTLARQNGTWKISALRAEMF